MKFSLINNNHLLFLVFLSLLFGSLNSFSQSKPVGFTVYPIVNGLDQPSSFVFAPDGRIFITFHGGKLMVLKNGSLLEEPVLELNVELNLERGLQQVVLDPDFENNQFIYVFYTLKEAPQHNRISKFKLSGDKAIVDSQEIIFDFFPLGNYPIHNGGAMKFAKDGTLFVTHGDGSVALLSQDLKYNHGKILRMNPDGSVPADNPFVDSPNRMNRYIWASGLRNPFSMDIDPKSGKIYVNDVGNDTWEEINDASIPGLDFGWPQDEGIKENTSFTNPVYAYHHDDESISLKRGCAITGGAFFNPDSTNFPEVYKDKYFFMDFCLRWINYLDLNDSSVHNFMEFPESYDENYSLNYGGSTIRLQVGPDGNLYFLGRETESLYRIVYQNEKSPKILNQSDDQVISENNKLIVRTFTSGDSLSFQWYKNDILLPDQNKSILIIDSVKFSDAGDYHFQASNGYGNTTGAKINLSVTEFNSKPDLEIIINKSDSLFSGGDTIYFSGTATDLEDGDLDSSTFQWQVNLHHEEHVHDAAPFYLGESNGHFVIPRGGELSPDIWYRIILTAQDSKGVSNSIYKEIFPRKTQLTIQTVPDSLWIIMDGYNEFIAPKNIIGVAGMERNLDFPEDQNKGGINYRFSHWIHGGDANQTFIFPENDSTITAVFEEDIPDPIGKPKGFTVFPFIQGIEQPSSFAFAPDGRIFLTSHNGKVRVYKNGKLLEEPALELNVELNLERGLQQITLDPNFEENQFIYVFYTLKDAQHNRISRFKLIGDKADVESQEIIFNFFPLGNYPIHNGGAMKFAKDGTLFVTHGDGSVAKLAQDLKYNHGKILRMNSDGSVPLDNPFVDSLSRMTKYIWAYGLRNPFSMDIDAKTGKIFVNDVGNNSWEEINDASKAGRNFGWPNDEGLKENTEFSNPIYAYNHGDYNLTSGCAITGGAFFNPDSTNYPSKYQNKYFFMDFCYRWINYLDLNDSTAHNFMAFPESYDENYSNTYGGSTIRLQLGPDGNLYFLGREKETLYKIIYSPNGEPEILNQTDSQSISENNRTVFRVFSTGDNLSYQWSKDGKDLPDQNKSILVFDSVKYEDEGEYLVEISNIYGSTISKKIILSVTEFNAKPELEVLLNYKDSLFSGGDTIMFSGIATDLEDGELDSSTFEWQVNLHHEEHVHDAAPFFLGEKQGHFIIPKGGELSPEIWYRIILTARDSKGVSNSTYKEVFPRKSKLTISSIPDSLWVIMDGYNEFLTPKTIEGVAGMNREIDLQTIQTKNSIDYEFSHWVHGSTSSQTFEFPKIDSTITAVFEIIPLGLSKEDRESSLIIFPNPGNGIFYIKEKEVFQYPFEVEVFNYEGKSISNFTHSYDKTLKIMTLDLTQLKNGLYNLKLVSGGNVFWKKIILIR